MRRRVARPAAFSTAGEVRPTTLYIGDGNRPVFSTSVTSPASETRLFTAIPAVERTGSRVWCAFAGNALTAGEAPGGFISLRRAEESDLSTWSIEGYFVFAGDATRRAQEPQLWTDPDGTLWVFASCGGNNETFDGILGTWATFCTNPTASSGRVWAPTFRVSYLGWPGRPFTVGGKWYLPVDYWAAVGSPDYPAQTGRHVFEIDYRNRSFTKVYSAASGDSYDESSYAELSNGDVLSVYRTEATAYYSTSDDGMNTWTAPAAFAAPGTDPVSRSRLVKLASGRLAYAFNNASDRSNITLKLSGDDGATWPYSVLLDARSDTSYPDVAADGEDIYVTWDYDRDGAQEILLTKLDEAAIVAGTQVVTVHDVV